MAAYPEFHVRCRLGRNFLHCLYAAADANGIMDCDQKKLYHTRSVAMTPAPVRIPTQCRLSRVSRSLGRKRFTLPSYNKNKSPHEY